MTKSNIDQANLTKIEKAISENYLDSLLDLDKDTLTSYFQEFIKTHSAEESQKIFDKLLKIYNTHNNVKLLPAMLELLSTAKIKISEKQPEASSDGFIHKTQVENGNIYIGDAILFIKELIYYANSEKNEKPENILQLINEALKNTNFQLKDDILLYKKGEEEAFKFSSTGNCYDTYSRYPTNILDSNCVNLKIDFALIAIRPDKYRPDNLLFLQNALYKNINALYKDSNDLLKFLHSKENDYNYSAEAAMDYLNTFTSLIDNFYNLPDFEATAKIFVNQDTKEECNLIGFIEFLSEKCNKIFNNTKYFQEFKDSEQLLEVTLDDDGNIIPPTENEQRIAKLQDPYKLVEELKKLGTDYIAQKEAQKKAIEEKNKTDKTSNPSNGNPAISEDEYEKLKKHAALFAKDIEKAFDSKAKDALVKKTIEDIEKLSCKPSEKDTLKKNFTSLIEKIEELKEDTKQNPKNKDVNLMKILGYSITIAAIITVIAIELGALASSKVLDAKFSALKPLFRFAQKSKNIFRVLGLVAGGSGVFMIYKGYSEKDKPAPAANNKSDQILKDIKQTQNEIIVNLSALQK